MSLLACFLGCSFGSFRKGPLLLAFHLRFFFFDVDHFFFKYLLNLLQYCFYFMFCFVFWPQGMWDPRPRMEPRPPALEGKPSSLDHQGSSSDTLSSP